MEKALEELELITKPAFFILKKNNVRLLQIFNSKDVKNWKFQDKNQVTDGMVLELTFNNEMPNNSCNFQRFLEADFYYNFYKVDLRGGDVYFMNFPNPVDFTQILQNIHKIITYVYGFDVKEKYEWGVMIFD